MPNVSFIPAGYHAVVPYLSVRGAAQAIDFYKQSFGAEEIMRMPMPDGKIAHAEIKIGDAHVMLADESPQFGNLSPQAIGGSPVMIMIYVPKVDDVVQKAVANGAQITKPVQDQFYGDRSGSLTDPFGHKWTVATHFEDVTPEEMERRMSSMHQPA
jgi:PhnB protein